MKRKRSVLSIAMASIMLVSLCAVVSTTSVSAVPSSANATTSKPSSANVSTSQSNRANVQSGLVGAPAGIVGDPAVCSQGANSLDLFVRGTDNAIWWRHDEAGAWGSWKSLGGVATSSPSAASSVSGQIYVAVRGTNGQLYRTYTTNGGTKWSTWFSWGGQILEGTGPAVFSISSGGYQYAVTGTNHALYWWHAGFSSLGGYLTSSPSAASYGTGHVHIGVRGSNGAAYMTYTADSGTTWGAWSTYGGQILEGTGPAVVFDGNVIRYAVTGTNHALYYMKVAFIWENLSGYLISSPTAASHTTNAIDVFAIGSNGGLYSRWTQDQGTNWSPWYRILD